MLILLWLLVRLSKFLLDIFTTLCVNMIHVMHVQLLQDSFLCIKHKNIGRVPFSFLAMMNEFQIEAAASINFQSPIVSKAAKPLSSAQTELLALIGVRIYDVLEKKIVQLGVSVGSKTAQHPWIVSLRYC